MVLVLELYYASHFCPVAFFWWNHEHRHRGSVLVVGSFVTFLTAPSCALGVILVSRPLLGELAIVPCFRHLWSWALWFTGVTKATPFEDVSVYLALSGIILCLSSQTGYLFSTNVWLQISNQSLFVKSNLLCKKCCFLALFVLGAPSGNPALQPLLSLRHIKQRQPDQA